MPSSLPAATARSAGLADPKGRPCDTWEEVRGAPLTEQASPRLFLTFSASSTFRGGTLEEDRDRSRGRWQAACLPWTAQPLGLSGAEKQMSVLPAALIYFESLRETWDMPCLEGENHRYMEKVWERTSGPVSIPHCTQE